MATIKHRNDSFVVIYNCHDEDGNKRQKWETFKTLQDAKKRKAEIEYMDSVGKLTVPKCRTLNQLLDEYIELYGRKKWAISTFGSNVALIDHYIRPIMGETQLSEITPRILERYYDTLLKTKAVPNNALVPKEKLVTPNTVSEVHKILRSCFNQAIKWEVIEKNPAAKAMIPEVEHAQRNIWPVETMFQALKVCDDPRLVIAMNLAFCCSLRIGELLGLTWDCVDISPESIDSGKPFVNITKELQRVNRKVLDKLDKKDVFLTFPASSSQTATVLVLKKPKTHSSIRRVFMPAAVARMLVKWKEHQDQQKKIGDEYQDFNLVFAGELGYPVEANTINKSLRRLIKANNLPPVVFHSFRHASVTYKLRLNGGDIKAVQGDTGHAQAKMVTDTYSHILDDVRQHNAALFQKAFYSDDMPDMKITEKKVQSISEQEAQSQELSPEVLSQLLSKPEVISLLSTLARAIS